jgi:hypothetical protein
MGEQGRELIFQRRRVKPRVEPKGSRSTIAKGDNGDRAEMGKACTDPLPNGSVEVMRFTEVVARGPPIRSPKPTSPRGRRVRVKFREKFREQGSVLTRNRENSKTAKIFR